MKFSDLIIKKRDGQELTADEIKYMVQGYTNGVIPDYQMAAMAMAIYFQGMTNSETVELTNTMAQSGKILKLDSIKGVKVDKHSTGGVGDKVTLVLIPLMAVMGYRVAKMSGRGLGHTGGTIDKLESIPGYRGELSFKELLAQVEKVGAAIVAQTEDLTPADKKLYSLRDTTGTVESIPLIASSIMSKKIAAGAERLVLDVKVGRGAFMKELEMAKNLARTMVQIGNGTGLKTSAILSNMDEPLGHTVGNSLEVQEAIDTLKGQGPLDLRELVIELAIALIACDYPKHSREHLQKKVAAIIDSGQALGKFQEIVNAQGGKIPDNFQLAIPYSVVAQNEGFVQEVDALKIGKAVMHLGAGRRKIEDNILHDVGIYLHKKTNDPVEKDEPLATIYARNKKDFADVRFLVDKAYRISSEPLASKTLIYESIIPRDE